MGVVGCALETHTATALWLRGALSRQNVALDELRATVATLTRQQTALGERLTAVTAHATKLQVEVARLQGENVVLHQEVTHLQVANARLRAALQAAGGRDDSDGGYGEDEGA